ncbi:MAG: DegT/DnrJ/EryC1/StrS family aminotransferase [Endomicrobia bacterium]|nr:DegT/DnrJ/EryC1/StrS family aminotransferase [Endomicrobiia bacterium]
MIEWPIKSQAIKENLLKVIDNNVWWSREGEFVYKFQDKFKGFLDVTYCLACTNGSHALKLALRALDIGYMDYVIVPSITFIATAFSVLDVGAIPVFADVDLKTSCIDIESVKRLKEKYGEKVKCIIPVHMGGQCCNIEELCNWAKSEKIAVVEDCAQAIGTEYKGKYVGNFGDIGCFSFQNSKNITSGEGGAVVTNNKELAYKISKYLDYNHWFGILHNDVLLGGNYRISEFQAAVLEAQVDGYEKQNALREKNYYYLANILSKMEGLTLMEIPKGLTKHGCHLFMFRYHKDKFNNRTKSEFIECLRLHEIPCWGGYDDIPLNKYPYFMDKVFLKEDPLWSRMYKANPFHYPESDDCTNAEKLAEEFVWIPQFFLLRDEKQINEIIIAINNFKELSK